MLVRHPTRLTSSDITDPTVYLTRRQWMVGAAALVLMPGEAAAGAAPGQALKATRNDAQSLKETPTKFEEFAFGDARIRLRGRQVFKGGREVRLTRKEFDLLVFLVEHRGEIITRERLLDEVWGYERFPTTRTVDTHVLRLRRKFEADPDRPTWILTVHGQGYRFAAP